MFQHGTIHDSLYTFDADAGDGLVLRRFLAGCIARAAERRSVRWCMAVRSAAAMDSLVRRCQFMRGTELSRLARLGT